MTDRTLLNRAQVARRLGITVERFYHKTAELAADGFPAPAHGRGVGARWDPVAIDRWLDRKIPKDRGDQVQGAAPDDDYFAALLDRNAERLTH